MTQRILEEKQRLNENTQPRKTIMRADLQAIREQRLEKHHDDVKQRIRYANPSDPEKYVKVYEQNFTTIVQPLDTLIRGVVNELVENRQWQIDGIKVIDPEYEGINLRLDDNLAWHMDFKFERPNHLFKARGELSISVQNKGKFGETLMYCSSLLKSQIKNARFQTWLFNYATNQEFTSTSDGLSEEDLVHTLIKTTTDMLVEEFL